MKKAVARLRDWARLAQERQPEDAAEEPSQVWDAAAQMGVAAYSVV